jgi:16S rRNA (cytosine1402-N4)-methyltransferase
METETVTHRSVLLEPSIELLALQSNLTVVDGTFGGGGHSAAILEAQQDVKLICVDLDEAAKQRFTDRFGSKATFVHANFKDAENILEAAGLSRVDRVLLDLGTSTFQLLSDTRGFSFNSDAPLSMTFSNAGSHTGFSAYDVANAWGESSIADIIYYYGGERNSRKIAHAIVEARNVGPIKTSRQLADIIESASKRRGKAHPATKTFQAIRIAVNDEIGVITQALDAWWSRLAPGGRIVVITFHSLEDRTVKHWMQNLSPKESKRVITKKPLAPSRTELLDNPRARSAKLRAIEKLS